MNQRQASIRLLFMAAAASTQTIACGRSAAPELAATTSANVAAPPASAEGEGDGVCGGPNDETLGEEARGNEAPSSGPAAAIPARAGERKRLATGALAIAGARGAKATGALDQAIAASVARDDEEERSITAAEALAQAQPAAPPVERPGPEVRLTSATLPQAAPAPRASSRVMFDSRLPVGYRLERVRMLVDGVGTYDAGSAGSVRVPPGGHLVEVIADYRLSDSIFTYMRDYRVELRSSEAIPASSTPVVFVATATRKGGATTPIDKQAALEWRSFPEQAAR
jgi:hypothetical protein